MINNIFKRASATMHPLIAISAIVAVLIIEVAALAFLLDMKLLAWAAIANLLWIVVMTVKAVRNG